MLKLIAQCIIGVLACVGSYTVYKQCEDSFIAKDIVKPAVGYVKKSVHEATK